MSSCAVSVYSLANANTLSYPTAIQTVTNASGDYSTTLNVQAGDVSVFGTRVQGAGSAAYSSPFVLYFDGNIESGSTAGSSAGAEFTTTNSSYNFSFTSTSSIPLPIVGVVIRNS
jgi:hypothetical protein